MALRLDPNKEFEKDQKRVSEGFKKTKDEATKAGKQIEDSSTHAADAINLITRRVLELWAALVGSRALADFIDKLDVADASLGRFASALGQSPQRVAAWENASERFGGSAGATAATLEKVNKQLFDLNRNGQMLPREFSQLQAWTGMHIDPNHGINKYLHDTSAALQRLHNIDPSAAHNVAMALGIDPGTEQLMYKMGAGIDAYLQKLEKSLSPSDKAIKAAQELQERWRALQQQVIALANKVMATLGPALVKVIDQMSKWIDKNKDWLNTKIVETIENFAQALPKLASDIDHIAKAFGGWEKVMLGLVAAFMALKALQVAAMIAGIVSAFGGGGAAAAVGAAAGGAGLGILGTLGIALGGLFGLGAAIKYGGSHLRSDPHAGNHGTIGNFLMEHLRKSSTTVDGRPVSKSNPLPVTNADQQSTSSGGFWSSVGNAISSIFGGGSSGAAVKASAGVGKWWTPQHQEHAYERLRKEAGLSDAGARALVSRWSTIEARGGPTSANNIGGGHFGIGQWGKSRNGIWGDPNFDHQLSFAIRELNTTEKVAGDALRRANSDAEGAVGASMYERAEGYNRWTGMDNFTRATLPGMKGVVTGANAAALSNIGATHAATTSNTANTTHIGKIDIHTQATDANGIASDIDESLRRKLFTAQANYGLA